MSDRKRIAAVPARWGGRVSHVLGGIPVGSMSLKVEIAPRSDMAPNPASEPSPPGQAETLDQQVTQVFKQFRDSVYRYLVVVLNNPSTAEEITQEAFLRFYGCLRKGQAITSVRSWVFRVARNLALNENAASRFLEIQNSVTLDRLRAGSESVLLDPEQSFLRRERVHIAMRELSLQQRECLSLRAEGFRYREIAQILGINLSTVAQSLRRGIKKLAKELP